jgi:thiol-disulfide isomerase/thioredoxin
MKTIKFLIVVLFCSLASFAQTEPKVVAVVTKANWCPACVQNGERVMAEVLSKVDAEKVAIVANDLTDDKTKMASKEELKKFGIEDVEFKSTAIISFVDVKSKKVLKRVSVTKGSDALLKEFVSIY